MDFMQHFMQHGCGMGLSHIPALPALSRTAMIESRSKAPQPFAQQIYNSALLDPSPAYDLSPLPRTHSLIEPVWSATSNTPTLTPSDSQGLKGGEILVNSLRGLSR